MSHITKKHCKTCKKYYEGRGKIYCSNSCCKKDPEYQIKKGKSLLGKPAWNKNRHIQTNDALKKWFENGGTPWNKGLKGIHLSPQSEFKKGDKRIMGKNNYNWKGGITNNNEKIRKSIEYKQWAMDVYSRDKWRCQHCDKKCQTNNIIAHHLYYFSWIPETRLSLKNGATLCRSCHLKLHQSNSNLENIFYETIKQPDNYRFIVGQNLS